VRDEADGAERDSTTRPWDRHMLEALVCPETRALLSWDPQRQELVSRAAHLAYPVRNGIPVMLRDEARPLE